MNQWYINSQFAKQIGDIVIHSDTTSYITYWLYINCLFAISLWNRFLLCKFTIDKISFSRKQSESTINSPSWQWTYYLLREFTVSFSWMHSEPNNLTLDSILITWIDYLFRESNMNQLSSSWLYYESIMKVWYFFQLQNRSISQYLYLEYTMD